MYLDKPPQKLAAPNLLPGFGLRLCVSGLLALLSSTTAQGQAASQPALAAARSAGVVFHDRNANGVRDAGEPGLSGVVVSNQVDVARTDGDGRYELPATGFGAVFVSLPNGYRSVGPIWRRADISGGPDFPLQARSDPSPFIFAVASDTHIAPSSVERTRRLRQVVDSLSPALLLINGDLIRDALRVSEEEATGFYRLFEREIASFATPVFTVPGNHEIFGVERHLSLVSSKHPLYGRAMYRAFRGPDYYSFNAGGIHFVALNTIDVHDLWYYGHVDSVQLEWLRRDLAMVPPEVPVITFNHIPFYTIAEQLHGYTEDSPAPSVISINGRRQFRHNVSNVADVLRAVGERPYPLALGGHVHFRERITLEMAGRPIRFHQAAATVATTKAGPFTLPSGVTLYTVSGGAVNDGVFVPLDLPPPKP